jgi:hypothetical protein
LKPLQIHDFLERCPQDIFLICSTLSQHTNHTAKH